MEQGTAKLSESVCWEGYLWAEEGRERLESRKTWNIFVMQQVIEMEEKVGKCEVVDQKRCPYTHLCTSQPHKSFLSFSE